jgi:hypothetical protein
MCQNCANMCHYDAKFVPNGAKVVQYDAKFVQDENRFKLYIGYCRLYIKDRHMASWGRRGAFALVFNC